MYCYLHKVYKYEIDIMREEKKTAMASYNTYYNLNSCFGGLNYPLLQLLIVPPNPYVEALTPQCLTV